MSIDTSNIEKIIGQTIALVKIPAGVGSGIEPA